MPRTLHDITAEQRDSATLRGLVSVLHAKLELRARYSLLEYEAGHEGRPNCAALFRELAAADRESIERLATALAAELKSTGVPA
jgi:hypothetical protein